jgi:putative transposase
MIKNKKIAKKASENMYFRFKTFAFNKFSRNNKKIYLSDQHFPSTQMCSCCGKVKSGKEKLKLSERVYKCQCGFKMNRDDNASINIYNCRDVNQMTK